MRQWYFLWDVLNHHAPHLSVRPKSGPSGTWYVPTSTALVPGQASVSPIWLNPSSLRPSSPSSVGDKAPCQPHRRKFAVFLLPACPLSSITPVLVGVLPEANPSICVQTLSAPPSGTLLSTLQPPSKCVLRTSIHTCSSLPACKCLHPTLLSYCPLSPSQPDFSEEMPINTITTCSAPTRPT